MNPSSTPEAFAARSAGTLPGLLGMVVTRVGADALEAEMPIAAHHRAPNGYLHAASLVALADTACGYGCMANLPEGATGFTTIELKSNFLGTALDGTMACVATPQHLGGRTQVWDAVVTHRETGRTLALFRCTQMVLRKR
jgi:1,4-dihydroxy-2-naphthoyl-CoA hydrolase